MKRILFLILLVLSSVVSAKTYYVSTAGKDSNLGTISAPWATWKKGFETALPGDTVYFRGGIYKPTDVAGSNYVAINGRIGTRENPICLFAYPSDYTAGNFPVLDCSLQKPSEAGFNTAIQIGTSSHYKFKGLTICNVWQSPIGEKACAWGFYECTNLTFEECTAHQIGGRGFHVLNYSPSVVDSTFFINCDAYDCADSLSLDGNGLPNYGNGADGFFIQMTDHFPQNYCLIEGCRAWHCSDDQFNLDQSCLTVTRNCWAFNGGYPSLAKSEGNGFKIGDPPPHSPDFISRITYNNISANNEGFGYDPNNALGGEWPRAYTYNNLSYNNKVGYLVQNVAEAPISADMNIYRNNISYLDSDYQFEDVPAMQSNFGYVYTEDHNTWQKKSSYPYWQTNPSYTVNAADFISLDVNELKRPRKSDGSLPDVNFGKLAAGSDLIDGGIADDNFTRLGMTYNGTAPDLGYSEYLSGSASPSLPVYLSSVIENATPSRLEMTYSLTLANIVPAASAFTVNVNNVTRTVTSVAISGTKVLLTLSSPAVYGDVVKVSYTKPTTNPLQTSASGQATSITSQSVTNNVAAISPVYISSVIENATPSRLEMTYSLTLANIVPPASAFTVNVNNITRTVTSVAISGTKVLLTLSSPAVYGDVVKVSYTKPTTNPLQTSASGQATSITSQSVTNNVAAISPVYISSVIENATPSRLEMTYSLTLANIVPPASAFTVNVNNITRTVTSVAISGTKVLLTLSSPAVYGDVVKVSYTKPTTNPLQTSASGQATSITSQSVTNNVAAISPVYISSVIENATPSRLEMTYSLTLANIVPAASAFTVNVNNVTRTVSSVAISGTKVLLTLSSPAVYGDVVKVSYTKPTTNPLQTSASGQATSITSQSVTNNVAAISPVYISSVIENATPSRLEMTYSLTLANIVPPASAFTVNVNNVTRTVSSVSISGTKVLLTLSSPAVYGDVVKVSYTKPTTNPLQTSPGGQAENFTAQSVINNCSLIPNQPPVIIITSPTKSITFVAPATITIEISASDPDGLISKIELYNGSTKLGEGSLATFSFTWKDVQEGTYSLTAIATDNLNAKTVSTAVNIVVEKSASVINQLPVVSIIRPNNGKKPNKNDNVVIEVVASDPDGTITKVEFKNGSTTLAEVTTAPYIYLLENVDTGTYFITAIATDDLGAQSISSPLEFKVLANDANSEIINLYPNPNDGHFKVEIYTGLSEKENSITIMNLSGRTIYNEEMTESPREFDISGSAAGTYVLIVTNNNTIVSAKKFIKK